MCIKIVFISVLNWEPGHEKNGRIRGVRTPDLISCTRHFCVLDAMCESKDSPNIPNSRLETADPQGEGKSAIILFLCQ